MIRLIRPRSAARRARRGPGLVFGPGIDRLVTEALDQPARPLAEILAGHLPAPVQYRCGVCRDGREVLPGSARCFRCGIPAGGER